MTTPVAAASDAILYDWSAPASTGGSFGLPLTHSSPPEAAATRSPPVRPAHGPVRPNGVTDAHTTPGFPARSTTTTPSSGRSPVDEGRGMLGEHGDLGPPRQLGRRPGRRHPPRRDGTDEGLPGRPGSR